VLTGHGTVICSFLHPLGTDPHEVDSDGDGFDDNWEFENDFDPANPDINSMQFIVIAGPYVAVTGFVILFIVVELRQRRRKQRKLPRESVQEQLTKLSR
jgi:hypothetical protein